MKTLMIIKGENGTAKKCYFIILCRLCVRYVCNIYNDKIIATKK